MRWRRPRTSRPTAAGAPISPRGRRKRVEPRAGSKRDIALRGARGRGHRLAPRPRPQGGGGAAARRDAHRRRAGARISAARRGRGRAGVRAVTSLPGPRALAELDAVGTAEAVRARRLGARDAVEAALARIADRNTALNCFTAVLADTARRDAEAVDARG